MRTQSNPFDRAIIDAIQGNKPDAYKWPQKAIDAGWRDYRGALVVNCTFSGNYTNAERRLLC